MKKIFILLLLLICPFVVNAKEITEEDVIKSVKNLVNVDFTKYGMLNVKDVKISDGKISLYLDNKTEKRGFVEDKFELFKTIYDYKVDEIYIEGKTAEEAYEYYESTGRLDDLFVAYYNEWEDGVVYNYPKFNYYYYIEDGELYLNQIVLTEVGRITDNLFGSIFVTYDSEYHSLDTDDLLLYDLFNLTSNYFIDNTDYYFYYAIASLYNVSFDDVLNYRKTFDDYNVNIFNLMKSIDQEKLSYCLGMGNNVLDIITSNNQDNLISIFTDNKTGLDVCKFINSNINDKRFVKYTDNNSFSTSFFDVDDGCGDYFAIVTEADGVSVYDGFFSINYRIKLDSNYAALSGVNENPQTYGIANYLLVFCILSFGLSLYIYLDRKGNY